LIFDFSGRFNSLIGRKIRLFRGVANFPSKRLKCGPVLASRRAVRRRKNAIFAVSGYETAGRVVESRTGAVAGCRPVSRPRSSNRTCGFPASGFPTGFTARPTAAVPNRRAGGGALRGCRTPPPAGSGGCRARAPCDVEPGSVGRGRRHDCLPPGTPAPGYHSRNTCSSLAASD
jgi:hypothetical protein